jgi:hypothetical protein
MTPKEKEETKAMVEEVKWKEESSSEKFIFRVRAPPLQQVHKENDERKVSDLHDNVHIVKRKEHKFVKSSSHKLDFVKR